VAFQEAIVSEEYDQVTDLLGSEFHIAHQTGRESDGQGISIASRWPLEDVREIDLHVTPRTVDFACTTLIAKIAAPDPVGSLLFVNHLPSFELGFELERELQAVLAARYIEEFAGGENLHVIVAGDFDAVPEAASVRFWSGRQSLHGVSVCYRDAWESVHPGDPGHTFSPDNPLVPEDVPAGHWSLELGRRIDYIMLRCGKHGPTLDICRCQRLFDQPVGGVWASDHFGVVADLIVPTSQESRSRT
jgi:endonuclease/exonuclease/phosphatase family metal-dependent hydrolase